MFKIEQITLQMTATAKGKLNTLSAPGKALQKYVQLAFFQTFILRTPITLCAC